jgi:hypothetical protein
MEQLPLDPMADPATTRVEDDDNPFNPPDLDGMLIRPNFRISKSDFQRLQLYSDPPLHCCLRVNFMTFRMNLVPHLGYTTRFGSSSVTSKSGFCLLWSDSCDTMNMLSPKDSLTMARVDWTGAPCKRRPPKRVVDDVESSRKSTSSIKDSAVLKRRATCAWTDRGRETAFFRLSSEIYLTGINAHKSRAGFDVAARSRGVPCTETRDGPRPLSVSTQWTGNIRRCCWRQGLCCSRQKMANTSPP